VDFPRWIIAGLISVEYYIKENLILNLIKWKMLKMPFMHQKVFERDAIDSSLQ
jgi:hypothetical protein